MYAEHRDHILNELHRKKSDKDILEIIFKYF